MARRGEALRLMWQLRELRRRLRLLERLLDVPEIDDANDVVCEIDDTLILAAQEIDFGISEIEAELARINASGTDEIEAGERMAL